MKTSHNAGFTLVEIMIVVAIIGMLVAIAIPNIVKARETAQLNAIINNLRIIESAKDQWAIESKKGTGAMPAATDIEPYFKTKAMPSKVAGELYSINPVGTGPTAMTPVKLGAIAIGGTVTLP